MHACKAQAKPGVDTAMALNAADPTGYMSAVVEEHVIREVMNLDPVHWHSGFETASNRLKCRAIGENSGVTVHASLCRRDRCKGCLLHRSVAIAAIDAQFANVEFVAVRHRLFWHVTGGDRLGRKTEEDQQHRIGSGNRTAGGQQLEQLVEPGREDDPTLIRGSV